jgi:hypothetical protein
MNHVKVLKPQTTGMCNSRHSHARHLFSHRLYMLKKTHGRQSIWTMSAWSVPACDRRSFGQSPGRAINRTDEGDVTRGARALIAFDSINFAPSARQIDRRPASRVHLACMRLTSCTGGGRGGRRACFRPERIPGIDPRMFAARKQLPVFNNNEEWHRPVTTAPR